MPPCRSLQSLQLCSFRSRKSEIPAKLQELQTANGGLHLQESTEERIMNGYNVHLQKYRPDNKTVGVRQEVLLRPLILTRWDRFPSLTT